MTDKQSFSMNRQSLSMNRQSFSTNKQSFSTNRNKSEIVLYQTPDGKTKVDVRFEGETAWLSQTQIAELFESTKQNVSLHINNIFKEGELERNSVVKVNLTTAADGKK